MDIGPFYRESLLDFLSFLSVIFCEVVFFYVGAQDSYIIKELGRVLFGAMVRKGNLLLIT